MKAQDKLSVGFVLAGVAAVAVIGAYTALAEDTPTMEYYLTMEKGDTKNIRSIVWFNFDFKGDTTTYVDIHIHGWDLNDPRAGQSVKVSPGKHRIPFFSSLPYDEYAILSATVDGPVKAVRVWDSPPAR